MLNDETQPAAIYGTPLRNATDAAAAGEASTRLNLVAAWRESTVFSEAERAALALTEEGTRIADTTTASRV
jgi:alkylhydroperoxidase family enzyme